MTDPDLDCPEEDGPPLDPQADIEAPRMDRRVEAPTRPPTTAERTPEEHVLACCLLDGDQSIQACLDRGITAAYFGVQHNQVIFSHLSALPRPVTVDVLVQSLITERHLESAGGIHTLLSLSDPLRANTSHLGFFMDELVSAHRLRRLQRLGAELIEAKDAKEAEALATESIQAITGSGDSVTLASLEYNPLTPVPKPRDVYTAKGTPICTPGNLTTLYSQAKTGKTATVGAMLAAAFDDNSAGIHDTLQISGYNRDRLPLLHFDTEQSKYDHDQMIRTACRRVGIETPPKWFHSYHLTGQPAGTCRRLVLQAMRLHFKRSGGIFSVVIDGHADLVVSPNDEEECFPYVTEMHLAAITHACPIIGVLHMNPNSESDKGRGHLGSQLERKSESNLTLVKGDDGITRLFGLKQRRKVITKDEAICFKWDESKQMHVSCGMPDTPKPGAKKRHSLDHYVTIFPKSEQSASTFPILLKAASHKRPISRSQFMDLIDEGLSLGVVQADLKNPNEPKYWMRV